MTRNSWRREGCCVACRLEFGVIRMHTNRSGRTGICGVILDALRRGEPATEVAARLEQSLGFVLSLRNKAGIPPMSADERAVRVRRAHPPRGIVGSGCCVACHRYARNIDGHLRSDGKARRDEAIIDALLAGEQLAPIAARTGLTISAISRIRQRRGLPMLRSRGRPPKPLRPRKPPPGPTTGGGCCVRCYAESDDIRAHVTEHVRRDLHGAMTTWLELGMGSETIAARVGATAAVVDDLRIMHRLGTCPFCARGRTE